MTNVHVQEQLEAENRAAMYAKARSEERGSLYWENFKALERAYLAGYHSRDKEVDQLWERLEFADYEDDV